MKEFDLEIMSDFKLAIRAFQRAAVFKHDHTRNVLAARKV